MFQSDPPALDEPRFHTGFILRRQPEAYFLEECPPTSDSTPQRLARLVALFRFTLRFAFTNASRHTAPAIQEAIRAIEDRSSPH